MIDFIMTNCFKENVKEKNKQAIKGCIAESINRDPTFSTNSFNAHMDYVKKYGIDIIEPYKKRPDEYELVEDEWSTYYFYRNVEWLRLNFAPDERIPFIKKIGKKVFKSDGQPCNSSSNGENKDFNKSSQRRRNKQMKSSKTKQKIALVAGVVTAVGVITAIIITIVKIMGNQG